MNKSAPLRSFDPTCFAKIGETINASERTPKFKPVTDTFLSFFAHSLIFCCQAFGSCQSCITLPGFLASIKNALPPANSAITVSNLKPILSCVLPSWKLSFVEAL
jgi:hypothetical protein